MSGPLSPMDLDLLDFLCICAEKKIKVVRIKAPRLASLHRLREAGQVAPDDYLPSGPALLRWIERQKTRSEAATCARVPDEPPAPKAAVRGDGDARKVAPSPKPSSKYNLTIAEKARRFEELPRQRGKRDTRGAVQVAEGEGPEPCSRPVHPSEPRSRREAPTPDAASPTCSTHAITDDLRFFGHEWEPLGIVADRWGRGSGVQFRGTAIKLRDLGLVEMQFIRGVDAQARWRLAEIPSAKGPHPSTEPPAVAPTADESVVAADELRPAFEEPSRPVDLKVNARRRTSRSLPCSHANEAQTFQRQVQRAMRTNRANAEAFLDSGKTSGQAKSVSLKIEARKVELARIETARLEDPVEQAKTIIRRAGWVCFSAIISGGPVGKFYIGTRLVTEAQLLAQAEQLRARRRAG